MHEVGNRFSLTAMLVRSGNGIAPGCWIVGIAREKVGDPRVVEDVVRGEPPDPRESPDVDGKPGARRIPGARTRVRTCGGRQT